MKLDQIRWDSVAKLGAGALLAVAVATTVPGMLNSEKPAPLDPDVGVPQAAIPPPAPVAPPVLPVKPKKTKKPAKPKKKVEKPKRQKPRHHPRPAEVDEPTPVITPAAPVVTPSVTAEDFGFERP